MTGYLMIITNLIFDKDLFTEKRDDPFLITDDFIDIITNNMNISVYSEQDDVQEGVNESKLGGGLIIQKAGAKISLNDEFGFLVSQNVVSADPDWLNGYLQWLNTSITNLSTSRAILL